jgi:hypothetical protein
MDYDGEKDAKVQKTKFQLEAALGVKFESLLGKMLINVKHFVFFCVGRNRLRKAQQLGRMMRGGCR